MTGSFIDFYLEFRDKGHPNGLDNAQQAAAILTRAKSLIDSGYPGVAIIYSANEGQTDDLAKAYAGGQYTAHIGGGNQAQVMQHMETELGTAQWRDLQMKMRIAPITTIPARSDPLEIVRRDLARIGDYLEDGWAVLGWMNQGSRGTEHPYAIGGGYASNLRTDVADEIQNGLKAFAAKYPARAS